MPDIAEGRTAVREATRRAEEAAGIFRDDLGNETYADQTTPEVPELEGAVPVAASDQPLLEPAVTADTPTQQPPPVTPEPKEPTFEELIAEREKLLAQVEEQRLMIGRQSTEVGDVRQEIAVLREQVTSAQPATPAQAPAALQITQELINADPARATQLAFEQGNHQALSVAFEAWRGEDEFTAGQWLTDRRLEKQSAEFDAKLEAKLAEVQGQVEKVAAPIAASAEQTSWSNAFLEMQRSYPDFLEVNADTGKTNAQRLLEEVAPQFPSIARLIADGDVAAKVEGLTLLYGKGKLGNPAEVAAELQSAADEAAASAAAVRTAAASVNGQATAGQGSAVELTEEQQEVERYKERLNGKASLAKGWTGRSNA